MQQNLKEERRTPCAPKYWHERRYVKAVLSFIKDWLLYPFKHDLLYFMLLWVIISLPNCYSQRNHIVYVLYLAMMYYLITYVIVLALNVYTKVAKVLKPAMLLLAALVALLNIYCYNFYGCLLSNDFVQIIAGTNMDEAKEYFETFVSWEWGVLFTMGIAISVSVAMMLSRLQKVHLGKLWVGAIVMLLLSIVAIGYNSGILQEEFVNKHRWTFNFEEVVDLRNHSVNPQIERTAAGQIEQIVIILGESFSPGHSSLYGYEKETNPLLSKEAEKGNLLVFHEVKSPCTSTTAAFKYLLNTFQVGKEDGEPWYKHANIIEVMKKAGYYVEWISNQSEIGMFDNLPSGHARICDDKFFLGNEEGADRYDGGLIGRSNAAEERKNLVIYHLMGQHVTFQERYPKEYEHFKKDDYKANPEHQREILAAYDNATLYNDFVVSSLIDLYKEKDAIVFYFSDHGLDVFDTDPHYFGHAKATEASQKQGKKIPFMIYVSPLFKELHAEIVDRMRIASDKPFCTDKFIYAVMDVAGYRFADNDDVEKYSLFRNGQ